MRYQKIESQIWHDEKFIQLNHKQQLLFFYVLSSPHSNLIGLHVLKKGYVCEDINMTAKEVDSGLKALIKFELIKYDFNTSVIYIPNYLKHNKITNPNQMKAADKIFSSLPKSSIITEFYEGLTERLKKGISEVLLKQEEGEEEETEEETENTFLLDSIEYQLSELLFTEILKRNPEHKANLQTWSKDIDKMIRLDNRKPNVIKQVVQWSQKDPFWQNNILSTGSLRKQYDKLLIKMNSRGKGGYKTRSDRNAEAKEEFLNSTKTEIDITPKEGV